MRPLFQNCLKSTIYVDHKNLIQIFSLTAVSKPVAQKLQSWALEIQKFRYQIHYIRGEDNVWSDLMTRWGASTEAMAVKVQALSIESSRASKREYRVRPLQKETFVWPSVEEIRRVQEQYLGTSAYYNSDNLAVNKMGKVKIPLEAEDLRIRLCIIAHSGGNSGHLGYQAASAKLGQYFYWSNMHKEILFTLYNNN